MNKKWVKDQRQRKRNFLILKELDKKRMTQFDLALQTGLSPSTVSRIINNIQIPTTDEATKINMVLKIKLETVGSEIHE